ncbi:uncharacterized protein G2W53_028005 [Senna tora]|uniref:Uncharacterized protein n=1 Tax=Senna tora TaxID=362788 RepID=A0A834T4E6_9FABA|nr:uncharacterized protein G2W53_028005 [Senna tora]
MAKDSQVSTLNNLAGNKEL